MVRNYIELKYNGTRGIYFPHLYFYKNGIELNPGDVFKIAESEKGFFLRQKNKKGSIYTELKITKPKEEIKDNGEL